MWLRGDYGLEDSDRRRCCLFNARACPNGESEMCPAALSGRACSQDRLFRTAHNVVLALALGTDSEESPTNRKSSCLGIAARHWDYSASATVGQPATHNGFRVFWNSSVWCEIDMWLLSAEHYAAPLKEQMLHGFAQITSGDELSFSSKTASTG